MSDARRMHSADRSGRPLDAFAKRVSHLVFPPTIDASTLLRVGLLVSILVIAGVSVPAEASAAEAAPQADADSDRVDELDRWVPSMGVFGGFQQQSADGVVDPGMLNPDAPQCVEENVNCEISRQIQPFSEGDDEIRLFRAGLTFELMAPRFVREPAVPRLFVHIDPILATGFERSIAGTGNPGPMVEGALTPDATRSDAQAYSGQGSRVLAEVSPFVLGAGVGLAFTLDAFDQRFRIKPSFEYVREELTIKGRVNRVVQVAQIPRPNTPSDFRFISLRDRDQKTYHAIGPGLEIEIDSNRLGPFTLSPFIAGHGHYFLGNLDVDLEDTNEYDESTTWKFSRDRWQWEARLGVRLRWEPR